METINISSLKNNLSVVLKRVQKGQEVIVMDRQIAVAKISSCSHLAGETEGQIWLAELEKKASFKVQKIKCLVLNG